MFTQDNNAVVHSLASVTTLVRDRHVRAGLMRYHQTVADVNGGRVHTMNRPLRTTKPGDFGRRHSKHILYYQSSVHETEVSVDNFGDDNPRETPTMPVTSPSM